MVFVYLDFVLISKAQVIMELSANLSLLVLSYISLTLHRSSALFVLEFLSEWTMFAAGVDDQPSFVLLNNVQHKKNVQYSVELLIEAILCMLGRASLLLGKWLVMLSC